MVWLGLVDGVMFVRPFSRRFKYRYMARRVANNCIYESRGAMYCTDYCRCVTRAVLLRVKPTIMWIENLPAISRYRGAVGSSG